MVYMHLACVSEEKMFQHCPRGLVRVIVIQSIWESRHKRQVVGFAPARTHLSNRKAHCQRPPCSGRYDYTVYIAWLHI